MIAARIRQSANIGIAIAFGVAVGLIDSSPGWDDTGITAAGLFGGAFLLSTLTRSPAWLIGLAIGIWPPIFEFPSGNWGSLAALAVAMAGAMVGSLARRADS